MTSPSSSGDLTRRVPYVSRHRQELDRIKLDAARSRTYPVPEYFGKGGTHGDDDVDDYDDDDTRSRLGETQLFLGKVQNSIRNYFLSKTRNDWIETFLPAWRWLRVYRSKSKLVSDVIAGFTVGVMAIPEGMSYAGLAGLPVQYGLYCALMPVYAYGLFGSSRQLAVGPTSIISLLLSTGLAPIMDSKGISSTDPSYDSVYIRLAIQASLLVGLTYLIMGICRMGFVTIFLSHAVISGFTTGAAVIIATTQLKHIFGYNIPRSDLLYKNLQYLIENIAQFNFKVFLMGTAAILLVLAMKNASKKHKKLIWLRALGPLTVTILGIVISAACNLKAKGDIPLVGTIPAGLPSPTVSLWTPIDDFSQLFLVVISITIVGFMESISIGKQLAAKHKYEIDSSDELVGLGMANFVGAMFQSYPVTGSFSRSAVNHESGAQSGLAGIVTATLVGLVLLLLTSVFEILPLCILSAIVIGAVLTIMDFPEAMYLYKVHKFDFAVWVIAFLGTMFLGVEIGLAIAVGVSILIVIYESAYPHTAVLGRLPGTTVYRNVKQYPEAERTDCILIVRVDAPLFFANAQNVRDKIRKYRLSAEADLERRDSGELKYIIIEFTPVSHIDTSALHILDDMLDNYKSRGQQLCFCNPSLRVMERLVSSGFAAKAGRQHFFSCAHDAVNWCLGEMDVEALSVHNSNSVQGNRDEAEDASSLSASDVVNKEDTS